MDFRRSGEGQINENNNGQRRPYTGLREIWICNGKGEAIFVEDHNMANSDMFGIWINHLILLGGGT